MKPNFTINYETELYHQILTITRTLWNTKDCMVERSSKPKLSKEKSTKFIISFGTLAFSEFFALIFQ
jgi:hypothetical protein